MNPKQKFIRWFRENGWCFWFGGALPFVGYPITSWQWWFVVMPTVLLLNWNQSTTDND